MGDEVTNITPGDIVLYSQDVDLRPFIKDPEHKARYGHFPANPQCQLATYKPAYLENAETDPGPCAEIWNHQVKAKDSGDDFILSDKARKFYGE